MAPTVGHPRATRRDVSGPGSGPARQEHQSTAEIIAAVTRRLVREFAVRSRRT
jgi:hypothetical protein